ncbi:MAG: 2-oxoglutarate and iron-dependent oxygenase domain-containing protein [Rhizomicrobium sp.]
MQIPVIDIAPFASGDRQAAQEVAQAWNDAFSTVGFAAVAGHGIAPELLDGIYAQAMRFFERPAAEKNRFDFPDRGRGQGYLPMGRETVGAGRDPAAQPDLCESLTFANPRFDTAAPDGAWDARLYAPNLWPDDMPGFRETVEAYIAAGRALALELMRLSAAALGLADAHFTPFFDRMELNLRCVLYPDQPEPPPQGALRYAPHTDFSGFTILRQDAAPGGLQVKTEDGWIDVPSVPGTLVINAGDLIRRWTNDRWRSNLHRVVNPPRDRTMGTRRLSVVLFTGPNSDAEITCLPGCGVAGYPPILAGLHSEERMRQTYGQMP